MLSFGYHLHEICFLSLHFQPMVSLILKYLVESIFLDLVFHPFIYSRAAGILLLSFCLVGSGEIRRRGFLLAPSSARLDDGAMQVNCLLWFSMWLFCLCDL